MFHKNHHDFRMGLDTMHQLKKDGTYMLRVELWAWDNDTAYADYGRFVIGSEQDGY